jgi:hypothetical protein
MAQVQVRVKGDPNDRKARHILAEGRVRPGQTFWTSEQNAKAYIQQGIAEYVGGVGPDERQRAGPQERKPARAEAGKSSAVGQAGQSTDLARSSQSATAAQSSASRAGPASPNDKLKP